MLGPLLLVVAVTAPDLHLDLERPAPRVDFAADAAIAGAAALAWWALYEAHPGAVAKTCPCDRDDVGRLDRGAIGPQRPEYEPWSNVALGTAVLGSVGMLALTNRDTWANDALLLGQNVMFTGVLTQSMKSAAARPYPYMYANADAAQRRDGINYASFWSGHTAVAMAGAVSFAYLFAERHPNSRWRYLAWALAPAVALAAGALQVAASNHFPSDVAVGALAGAATSYLNLRLHTW